MTPSNRDPLLIKPGLLFGNTTTYKGRKFVDPLNKTRHLSQIIRSDHFISTSWANRDIGSRQQLCSTGLIWFFTKFGHSSYRFHIGNFKSKFLIFDVCFFPKRKVHLKKTCVHRLKADFAHLYYTIEQLRSLVVGEYVWLNSAIFFAISLIIIYIVTSTSRTHNARFWLITIAIIELSLEIGVLKSHLLSNDLKFVSNVSFIHFCQAI